MSGRGGATPFSRTHGPDGLLTALTDPKLGAYSFQYDAFGRLGKDENPAGGFTQLVRTRIAPSGDVSSGFEVTKSTALGRTTVYRTEELTTEETRLTVTDPAGLATVSLQGLDGSRTTTSPDGTVATATQGPDPRFDMQAPRLESLTVSTPGGLGSTTTTSRTAILVDPAGDPEDPANVASVTDSVTVNGKTATSVRDFVARQATTTTPEGRQSVTRCDVYGRTAETLDQVAIPLQIFLAQVVEQPAAMIDHPQQATARVMIALVGLDDNLVTEKDLIPPATQRMEFKEPVVGDVVGHKPDFVHMAGKHHARA